MPFLAAAERSTAAALCLTVVAAAGSLAVLAAVARLATAAMNLAADAAAA